MRFAKGFFVLSTTLIMLVSGIMSANAIAAYNTDGEITGVCYDAATTSVVVTVDFTGKTDDDGSGNDKFYVQGTSVAVPTQSQTKTVSVPADGNVHTVTVTFNAANADLSQGVKILAGEAKTALLAGSGIYNPLSACGSDSSTSKTKTFDAAPIPEGYTLATITCDTPVYDPGYQPIEGTLITAGQTWYVDPASTGDWTAIFVAGRQTGYIPSSCVSAAP